MRLRQTDLSTSHVVDLSRNINDKVASEMETFEKETCVRGYHAYEAIWGAAVGEELECRRERSNRVDRYAVAVVKDVTVVGHVSRTQTRSMRTSTLIAG